MLRTTIGILCVILLNATLAGCAKCGGWEKFNLPYSATGCDDASAQK